MSEDCIIASGTISVTVPNLEAFTDAVGKPKSVESKVEKIGGLGWRMEVRKDVEDGDENLRLYIFCNEDVKEHLWLCKVQFKIKSWEDGEEEKPFFKYSSGAFFGFNNYFWTGPINFMLEKLEKNSIKLKLGVKVLQIVKKSFPPLETNLVVNMGESKSETLFVNKYLLASFSSYFRNLFFGDWRDKVEQGGNQFELNEPVDFDIWAFKGMLYGAMTMGWMMQETNFFNSSQSIAIIKLGVKFDMALMVDYCEKSLVNAKEKNCQHSKMELLELADQFSLVRLKEHCLDEIGMLDYMEDFSKDEGVHSRLSKATREQLRSKLGEKARELCKETNELEADIRAVYPHGTVADRFRKMAKTMFGEQH